MNDEKIERQFMWVLLGWAVVLAAVLATMMSSGCLPGPDYSTYGYEYCDVAVRPTPSCEFDYAWVPPHYGPYGWWHDGHYVRRPWSPRPPRVRDHRRHR
jgi:hypothetical protein